MGIRERALLAAFLICGVVAFAQAQSNPGPQVPQNMGQRGAIGPQGLNGVVASAFSQITTNTAGAGNWAYPTAQCPNNILWAQAQAPPGSASVNVWNVGPPVSGVQTFQISLQVVIQVLGINVLQLNTVPGVMTLNVFCQ